MVFLTADFIVEMAEKRLDLKSLNRQSKAEELGTPGPELHSLHLSIKALQIEPFCTENSGKTTEPRVHRRGTDPLLKYIVGFDQIHVRPCRTM